MGTTAQKLEYLNETKNAIKTSIINSGVDVLDSTTFRGYAEKIDGIVGQFSDDLDLIIGADTTPIPDALALVDKINGEDISGSQTGGGTTVKTVVASQELQSFQNGTIGCFVENDLADYDMLIVYIKDTSGGDPFEPSGSTSIVVTKSYIEGGIVMWTGSNSNHKLMVPNDASSPDSVICRTSIFTAMQENITLENGQKVSILKPLTNDWSIYLSYVKTISDSSAYPYKGKIDTDLIDKMFDKVVAIKF